MKNFILKNIGKNIRIFRKERKLTIDKLAEMSGLSSKYLQSVEVGVRNISIKNLGRVTIALNLNFRFLISKSCAGNSQNDIQIAEILEKLKYLNTLELKLIEGMLDGMDIVIKEYRRLKLARKVNTTVNSKSIKEIDLSI